jgi:hypothetical protein
VRNPATLFAMWDIIALVLSLPFPGSRVTVKDRYEMKRKVRALKLREARAAAEAEQRRRDRA